MGQITDVQKEVHQTAQEHGWWDTADDCNAPTKLALAAGELVGEALEDFRANKLDLYFLEKNPETGKFGGTRLTLQQVQETIAANPTTSMDDFKPMGFGIELADAVIRIMDLAEWMDINLEELIVLKAAFNKSRPPRHGGKRV